MTLVKICGHTSAEDAAASAELGADFIGVVVEVPVATPRKIDRELAAEIVDEIPAAAKTVMVIMPPSVEEAVELYEAVKPDYVQLHGREPPHFLEGLRSMIPCKVIKTLHVGTDTPPEKVVEEAEGYVPSCDFILLDTKTKAMGGSGMTHDWSVSARVVEEVGIPVFLAGGLNPDNVKKAVGAVGPYCVDTSSGVEKTPGKKDPEKVRRFIERVK
jgi:phosphoribosylanthranilate isomerase